MVPVTSTEDAVEAPAKPLRADAQRNYDKLVAAAREVFAERGAEGSLDEIAKRAGVGPGTLYRHFPTRDDLIDALMRDWSARVLADSEAAVAADLPARETLERWFMDLIKHLTLHRGAAAKLSAAFDDPASPIYRKCQMLADANDLVVSHLTETHALRDNVESRQVMRLVSGIATVADASGIPIEEAAPMLDIVIDGILRDRATS
ncbi:TetR/AcrR family transcriptional regulator [Aeromicrobium ginsengisoli]|uniref:TetR/AcrR family transcriptional regulator n=1 Tax=Aeromicrobium ginsengisoli TaxID=363867 RepID=UPI001FE2AA77|nr:TetR/AcrR family transcriptional regulator [Aeromicrobium ginsengisoli]